MNEKDLNKGILDFEKMNATLANPNFANWYYNKVLSDEGMDLTMQDFVNIVNDYDEINL